MYNQYYKLKICDDILKCITEELNVKGNIHGIIEVFLEYTNENLKSSEKEHESKLTDYRDINVEDAEKILNQELSKLPIHQL